MKENFSPHEELTKFYREKFERSGVSSIRDISYALQEERIKPEDFEIKLSDYLDLKRAEEIERKNPDQIEILGQVYPVTYRFSPQFGFSASVEIPVEEAVKLTETPQLPSGKKIILVVKRKDYFSPLAKGELDEVKPQVIDYLIQQQWQQTIPHTQSENLNIEEGLPPLPEPFNFGVHPETKKPLYAYPAYEIKIDYWSNQIIYRLRYFNSEEEAQKVQETSEAWLKDKQKESRIKKEKEEFEAKRNQLVQQAKELLAKIEDILWSDKRLNAHFEKETNRLKNEIRNATDSEEMKKAVEFLELEIIPQLQEILEQIELLSKLIERAQEEVFRMFPHCPLCGAEWEEENKGLWICKEEHNVDQIIFQEEINQETGERAKTDTILFEARTEQGKIIADVVALSGFNDYLGYYDENCGRIILHLWFILERDDIWQESPYYSLFRHDYKRLVSLEEGKRLREKREKEEKKSKYQKKLQEAEKEVEQGYLKRGHFKKGQHPKTKEEQWEMEVKQERLIVKYIVDRYSRQPTNENFSYFFSEGKILIDQPTFKLVLVHLEEPYPEDAPDDFYSHKNEGEEETEASPKREEEESVEDKLEDLRRKWDAR